MKKAVKQHEAARGQQGFRLARLALWSQSDRMKWVYGVSISITRNIVVLKGFVKSDHLDIALREHKKQPNDHSTWLVSTRAGLLRVQMVSPLGWREARVSMEIKPDLGISDEGWLKSFDQACREIFFSERSEEPMP